MAKEFVLIKQIRAPIYANASEEEKRTNPECGMWYAGFFYWLYLLLVMKCVLDY